MSDDASHRAGRRAVLRTLAAGVAAGLAGCSGGSGTQSPTATPTPTAGVITPSNETGAPTRTSTPADTPGQVTVPDATEGTVRERVRRVGTAIRAGVVVLAFSQAADASDADAAGWVADQNVLATTSTALLEGGHPGIGGNEGTLLVYTPDGGRPSVTGTDATGYPGENDDDVGAVRIDERKRTLPVGDASDLQEGQVLVEVGHHWVLGEWIVKFGRFQGWTEDGERFRSTVPQPKAGPSGGAPTVTLDGEVVGMSAGRVSAGDSPSSARPPPTAEPTVHTERDGWYETTHEPVGDVMARLDAWAE